MYREVRISTKNCKYSLGGVPRSTSGWIGILFRITR